MTSQSKSPTGVASAAYKTAYICHALLAVFLCLALAMQIHLWAIDAKGEVVGAGLFLIVVWLGLPAIVLGVIAIYYSLKASDIRLSWLLIAIALPILAILFDAPALLLGILQVAYVVLVIVVGLLSRLKRVDEASG